ncbi:uncharacterized protein MYCFIDRAFT_142152 [Pseudocercospora fijiensis CIRAD86]|uniref:Glutathione S-transferase n=1 Tax=Pseudocercospora fijiensis (strain CIRAD86) TaxID=383855 RepID=M3ARG0_PSEFD|nr:uncharacterized protein MYCFIDRAFT_142152 [Pseudocercospora fijiensis CIRAD86]EME79658.1 hypothetical protein MYCFIDRAFT_142152 [Pseudocercospora fijiensis CIRAD86]
MSSIKLFFLQASRSIRTAWQLEELGLNYELKFAPRENGVAPPAFKKEAGGLGKFPSLEDEGIMYYESGDPQRYKALQWVHASEGMFLLHGLACLYAKWFQQDGDVQKTQEGMSKNLIKDMDYLQSELEKSSGKFLLGDKLTVADVMMHFSARFIIVRELGTMGNRWPKIEEWLDLCEAQPAYQAAVKKTGHQL